MGNDVSIFVDGLSKRYFLGRHAPGAGSLRHAMQQWAASPFRWLKGRRDARRPEEFWALRDISFEIKRGEVVGIIGRNGAGKSTLLKILSRITEPTSGRIGINGRTASLLEVGTGFHPELTGRENIFLNGAILGMSQAEVRRKLDEIIAFAGVEKFLETPVKRYSSGMYVRLAFAVAAHLEPDILVVDEVLAVGDAEFQRKCLGKMKEVTRGGRTVLFVSHNLTAVAALCRRGIYLKNGRMVMNDEVSRTLETYRSEISSSAASPETSSSRSGTGTHRVEEITPLSVPFPAREPMSFRVRIRRHHDDGPFHFSFIVRNQWDTEAFSFTTENLAAGPLRQGDQEFDLVIRSPWLAPGDYRAETFLYAGGIIDHWPGACAFSVGVDVAKHGFSHAVPNEEGRSVLPDFSLQPLVS